MSNLLVKSNIADIYPLLPLQKGMLFHAVLEPESTVYLEQLVMRVDRLVDAAALARAWNHLVEQNTVLRTVFRWSNVDESVQVVLKRFPLTLQVADVDESAVQAFVQRDR